MHSYTVDVGGPVHIAEHPGPGPTMVLVHGIAGSHVNWMLVGERLGRRHRVLIVDLPGFGLTPVAGRRSTVTSNARLLDRVIGRLTPEPVVLVGNSMGGLISLLETATNPHRVSGLILVDAALPAPYRARLEPLVAGMFLAYFIPGVGMVATQRIRRGATREQLVRGAMKLCTADHRSLPEDVVRAHIDLERQRGEDLEMDKAFLRAARSIVRSHVRRGSLRRKMRAVQTPTLLMHGRKDRVVNIRASEDAATLRPDWDFHRFDDTGHLPMMERPEEFCDVLEAWVDQHLLAGVAAASDG